MINGPARRGEAPTAFGTAGPGTLGHLCVRQETTRLVIMKGALEFGSLWSAEGYNGDCLGCHIQRAQTHRGPREPITIICQAP
jgi:hypothetical protein